MAGPSHLSLRACNLIFIMEGTRWAPRSRDSLHRFESSSWPTRPFSPLLAGPGLARHAPRMRSLLAETFNTFLRRYIRGYSPQRARDGDLTPRINLVRRSNEMKLILRTRSIFEIVSDCFVPVSIPRGSQTSQFSLADEPTFGSRCYTRNYGAHRFQPCPRDLEILETQFYSSLSLVTSSPSILGNYPSTICIGTREKKKGRERESNRIFYALPC